MKNIFLSFFILAGSLFSSVFSQTVYITQTGQNYHTAKCKYVSKASTAMSLYDVQQKGYRPCPKCKPPAKIGKPTAKKPVAKAKPAPQNATAKQCKVTIDGVKCKQMTKFANGLCSQHGGK